MKRVWMATMLVASCVALMGCKKKEPEHTEGPMESAGEEVDETADDVGDATEEAVDDTGDAMEETGDKVEDKTD
jgi:hypothetical protein